MHKDPVILKPGSGITSLCSWVNKEWGNAPEASFLLVEEAFYQKHRETHEAWQEVPGQLFFSLISKAACWKQYNSHKLIERIASLKMAILLGVLRPLLPYKAQLCWPSGIILEHKEVAFVEIHQIYKDKEMVGAIASVIVNVSNSFAISDEQYHYSTSLKDKLSQVPGQMELFDSMKISVSKEYQRWLALQDEGLFQEWKSFQAYLGECITTFHNVGVVARGTVEDFAPNGDLKLLDVRDKHLLLPFFHDCKISISKI